MAQSALTTIVIVSCNYARFVRDAVRSACEQTSRPQVVVVDDASTDGTPEVLRDLQEDYPSLVCHHLPSTRGLAQVRNLAIELVTTDWLVYLDADDWLDRSFIASGEAWLYSHDDVDVLTTDMTIVRNGVAHRRVRSKIPRFWNDLLVRNTIVQTSFIRRSMVRRLGGYDPSLDFEDWDFWIRVLQAGGRIARLPGAHVFWREHEMNKSKVCDQHLGVTAIREKHQRISC